MGAGETCPRAVSGLHRLSSEDVFTKHAIGLKPIAWLLESACLLMPLALASG
ncbi:MAG: hypothetical protein N3B10_00375 [Armatimonadetes bacterium]|nr:hypothetical protein [Armatimonadota bacterium]